MKPSPRPFAHPPILGPAACVSRRERTTRGSIHPPHAERLEGGRCGEEQAGGGPFGRFRKAIRRFDTDDGHAGGRSDGLRQRKSVQEAVERRIRVSLEQQKRMERKRHDHRQDLRPLETEMFKGVHTRALERDSRDKHRRFHEP